MTFVRSPIITKFVSGVIANAGSLIDLPRHSGIVGGLDTWPKADKLEQVIEPRLTRKITLLTGVPNPRLYSPPPDTAAPGETATRRSASSDSRMDGGPGGRQDRRRGDRSRRLVHRKELDEKGRFEGKQVVPTRFVRACSRGHIEDLDWRGYVHEHGDTATASCGCSSAAPAATSPTCACAASAGAVAACTRRPTSASRRSGNCRGRAALARGGRAGAVRTAEPTVDPDRDQRATSPRY